MRPLIGIVARAEYPGGTKHLSLNEAYRIKLNSHGADAFMILPSQPIDYSTVRFGEQGRLTEEEKKSIIRQIDMCDGVLLPGGFKTNNFDRFIAEYLIENDIPTLGICLGMQILANYKVPIIINDINESTINHKVDEGYAHEVTLDPNSKLFSIVGGERFSVNSRHNYHIRSSNLFDEVAHADDGIIEAIEMKDRKFMIGVQWHPENLEDEYANRLVDAFVGACKEYRDAKYISSSWDSDKGKAKIRNI